MDLWRSASNRDAKTFIPQLIIWRIENAESQVGQRLIRQTSRKVSPSERWLMQFKLRVKLASKLSASRTSGDYTRIAEHNSQIIQILQIIFK